MPHGYVQRIEDNALIPSEQGQTPPVKKIHRTVQGGTTSEKKNRARDPEDSSRKVDGKGHGDSVGLNESVIIHDIDFDNQDFFESDTSNSKKVSHVKEKKKTSSQQSSKMVDIQSSVDGKGNDSPPQNLTALVNQYGYDSMNESFPDMEKYMDGSHSPSTFSPQKLNKEGSIGFLEKENEVYSPSGSSSSPEKENIKGKNKKKGGGIRNPCSDSEDGGDLGEDVEKKKRKKRKKKKLTQREASNRSNNVYPSSSSSHATSTSDNTSLNGTYSNDTSPDVTSSGETTLNGLSSDDISLSDTSIYDATFSDSSISNTSSSESLWGWSYYDTEESSSDTPPFSEESSVTSTPPTSYRNKGGQQRRDSPLNQLEETSSSHEDSVGDSEDPSNRDDNPSSSSEEDEDHQVPQLLKVTQSGIVTNIEISIPRHNNLASTGEVLHQYSGNLVDIIQRSIDPCGQFIGRIKGGVTAAVLWSRLVPDEDRMIRERHFYSVKARLFNNERDIWLKNLTDWGKELEQKQEDADYEGSGWVFRGVSRVTFWVTKPKKLGALGKRGNAKDRPNDYDHRGQFYIFNPLEEVNCVMQCLGAYKILKARPNLVHETKPVTHQVKVDILEKGTNTPEKLRNLKLKFDDRERHIIFDELSTIEEKNNVRIFIYVIDKIPNEKPGKEERHEIIVARTSPQKEGDFIPLIMINGEHTALITHFDNFIGRVKRENRNSEAKFYCPNCLWGMKTKVELRRHIKNDCFSTTTIEMPPPGSIKKFKAHNKTHLTRYISFVDFETIQPHREDNNRARDHKAIMYNYVIVDRNGKIESTKQGSGPSCVPDFLSTIKRDWKMIRDREVKHPISMTRKTLQQFKDAEVCATCERTFKSNKDKHRHHDHSKDRDNYLGALCLLCNIACKDSISRLTVIAHNGLSFDIMLILKESLKETKFSILPKTTNHFHEVKIDDDLRFIDSRNFLNGSLSTLAKTHIESKFDVPITKNLLNFYKVPEEAHELLLKGKGVLPYSYLTSMEKLREKHLPKRKSFTNDLTSEKLPQDTYEICKEIWEKAKCETMMDYASIYLICDVGLLADVMINFRLKMHQYLGLDAFQYTSLPSVALDGLLKHSNVELDLLSDIHLYSLFEKNLRGGLSAAMKTRTKANNRFCKNFDPKLPTNYILYLDFNSLYGTIMAQFKLPIGDFKRLNEDQIEDIFGDVTQDSSKLLGVDTHGERGFVLLVDTSVPPQVARETDTFPLSIARMKISEDMLSDYNKTYLKSHNRRHIKNCEKLVASHLPQKGMFLHLSLLQELVQHGLKVDVIHEIYSFKQENFTREFVMRNILQRSLAMTELEKNLMKLLTNSLFGKFMQNPAKYSDKLEIEFDEYQIQKHLCSPFFKRIFQITDEKVGCVLAREKTNMNSPMYIGFCILDLAKTLMYRFYYSVLKKIYGGNVSLLYTDTDSMVLDIKCDDVYKDMEEIQDLNEWIDTSNFPETHPLYDEGRKGKLGLLKSETGSVAIEEAICLKAKTYSLLLADGTNKKAAKGVPYSCQKDLAHSTYYDTYMTKREKSFLFKSIRSVKYQLVTEEFSRTGLSVYDDKRFVIDEETSVSYGYPFEDIGEPRPGGSGIQPICSMGRRRSDEDLSMSE